MVVLAVFLTLRAMIGGGKGILSCVRVGKGGGSHLGVLSLGGGLITFCQRGQRNLWWKVNLVNAEIERIMKEVTVVLV